MATNTIDESTAAATGEYRADLWQIVTDAKGFQSIYETNEDGGPGDLVAHVFGDNAKKIVDARAGKPTEVLMSEACSIPPTGWWCSREAGHEGPCAARPVNPMPRLCEALRARFDDEPDFLGIEAANWIEVAGEALQKIHRYALAAEGTGYDLILSVTEPLVAHDNDLAA